MNLMRLNHINIIGKTIRLNSLILLVFFMLHQKVISSNTGFTKPNDEDEISHIKKDNERPHAKKANEIAVQNSTIFHYDFSDLDSYNRQTTSESNKTINDLSGNNNYGTVRNISKVYFDSEQNAMFFNGKNDEDATGISINNLNYVSGPSDQLESFTIRARIKAKSELTNRGSDERIIISFDRSAVFRLSIGSDADSGVEGKLVFGFANEDGSHTSFNSNQSLDLRDDQWHDIAVQFKANTQNGLKLFIDGNLIHSDPNSYKPIGGQDDNETPRYGNIGNGSEMQSATGTTNPDHLFYGWIQSVKFSNILEIDLDNDGIINSNDICPNTLQNENANVQGCGESQIDSDQDGVPDVSDDCPNTLQNENADNKGCGESQIDSDGDGIPDLVDNCSDTPNTNQDDHDNDGIGDVCDPDPKIVFSTFIVSEDSEIGTLAGSVEVTSPNGSEVTSIDFEGYGVLALENIYEIRLIDSLDFEEYEIYPFKINAKTATGETIVEGGVEVEDIPNKSFTANYSVAIFDTPDIPNSDAAKSTERYHNPFNRGVGKWKIRKKISGGADAHLFAIKSEPPQTRKSDEEGEGYLSFINPPDFNDPQDHNKDNIYEVEVTFINLEDGAIEVPIPVTQFQLQAPEGSTSVLELQSRPALPDDDSDGDGVPDIIDNSPVVFNPDQADEDGDGVGDVSDDFDHDGVWNPQDECPDTPFGVKVDAFGCEIFYLPSDNFNVYKTERCVDNHSIGIEFENISHSYTINISGAMDYSEVFNEKQWIITNLSSGQYNICLGVDGINTNEFERCFEIRLNDPTPLSVYSNDTDLTASADDTLDSVNFEMAGGSVYNIEHNGITTQTSRSSHSLALRKGLNSVRITTDQECQGVFEKQYFNSETVAYTPNPFEDELLIYVGGQDENILVEIFTTAGKLISSDNYKLNESDRNISVNTSNYKMGSYLFKVNANTVKKSFMAIKK